MYRLASFLFLITTAYGQIVLEGSCDLSKITYQQNLNVTGILGKWYDIGRINNTIQKGDCPSLTISTVRNDNGEISGVYMYIYEVVNNQPSTRNGTITMNSAYNFNVNFTDGVSFSFVILKTNYQDYAILYSCQNQANGRAVTAWQLSRTQTVSNVSTTNFDEVIKNNADLKNASWIIPAHSQGACRIGNGAINLHISPILLLISGLLVSKKYII